MTTKDTIGVVAIFSEVCGLLYLVRVRSRIRESSAVWLAAILVALVGFIMFLAPDTPTIRSIIYVVWAIALVLLLRSSFLNWREAKKSWQSRKLARRTN